MSTFQPYKHSINVLVPDPTGDAALNLNNDLKAIADFLDGVALTSGIAGSSITTGTVADARLSSAAQNAINEAHVALTIGTPSGLLLSGQSLSLALATTSAAGAMSAADKTILAGLGSLASLSSVDNAHVSTGIDAAKIGSGAVSNTEFGYLDGVTSAIQAQLAAKLPTTTFSAYAASITAQGYIGRNGGEIDGDLTISDHTLYADNFTLTNSGYFDLQGQGIQNCSYIVSGDGAEIDLDSSGATYLCNINMGGNNIDVGGGNINLNGGGIYACATLSTGELDVDYIASASSDTINCGDSALTSVYSIQMDGGGLDLGGGNINNTSQLDYSGGSGIAEYGEGNLSIYSSNGTINFNSAGLIGIAYITGPVGGEIDFTEYGIGIGGGSLTNVNSIKINSQTVFEDGFGGENPLLILEAPDYTGNSPFIYLRQPNSSNADLGIMFNVEEADTGDLLIRGYNLQAFPDQPYRAAGVRVSRDYGVVTLGDSTGEFNNTTLVVDDQNQTITLNAFNGITIDTLGSDFEMGDAPIRNVGELDVNGSVNAYGGIDTGGSNLSLGGGNTDLGGGSISISDHGHTIGPDNVWLPSLSVFGNSYSDGLLNVNPANGALFIGDGGADVNGTAIYLDDNSQTIEIIAANGVSIEGNSLEVSSINNNTGQDLNIYGPVQFSDGASFFSGDLHMVGNNIDLGGGAMYNVGSLFTQGGSVDLGGGNINNTGTLNFYDGTQVSEQYNPAGSGTVDLIISFNSSFPDSTLVCPSVTPNVIAFNPLSSAPSSPETGTIYVDSSGNMHIYNGTAWKQFVVA